MIFIQNLSKSYGRKELFKGLNLSINRGERIGLVGPNGAGKTTFFSMLLRRTEPSDGSIRINKNIRIGYLPQEADFPSRSSVLSEVVKGDSMIARLKKEKEELELKGKAGRKRYGDLLERLEFLGFFGLEHKAKKVLAGLGFKERDFRRPVTEMSGGWQMRVLLAKLLTLRFDLLLLDEPTNFLDLGAVIWFKDYLTGFKEAFIIISHDKDFLDEVTDYTLVLEDGLISKVHGNYEDYQKIKEERYNFLLKQFKEKEKKQKQLKKFTARFHAQPNKAAQVRAKRRVIEKMGEVVMPENRRASIRNFHFPRARRSGYRVITLNKIFKSYGEVKVYEDFDFEVVRGEKAVLVGENGAGKSTLLKILAGVIEIDRGRRTIGHNVDLGYFSQTRMEVLNPQNTVLEEASLAAQRGLRLEDIRTILGAFLFSGEDVDKSVSILSGGEKSRLILAKLLANPPNFLLLDEPTTHLDVDAVDALVKALASYEGAVVFISHDLHFIRSLANVVYEVKRGRVRKFPGSFDYYWQEAKDRPFVGEEAREDPAKQEKAREEGAEKEREGERKLRLQQERKVRKEHNLRISKKIKKFKKNKENLEIERYAKARVLSDRRSYRSEERLKECRRRLNEIDRIILEIDREIDRLKRSFK